MYTKYVVSLAFLLAACGQNANMKPPTPSSIKPSVANVVYAPVSSTQKLDIYLPSDARKPAPVVLMIHGGGFKFGDKTLTTNDEALAKALLGAGYALVLVDYRLSGEAQFPAAVQDVKAAVRFVRANAAQYGFNPNKIIAFGASAGGNLASMLGTSADEPSRVQGVVDFFGPTDFTQMDAQAKAQGCAAKDQAHGQADSFESLYLGQAVASAPELAQKANPINYVTAQTPPFLLVKGEQDCQVPVAQSQLLYRSLQSQHIQSELVLLKNAQHGGEAFSSPEVVQKVLDFVNSIPER